MATEGFTKVTPKQVQFEAQGISICFENVGSNYNFIYILLLILLKSLFFKNLDKKYLQFFVLIHI